METPKEETKPEKPSLTKILSESKKIIKSNRQVFNYLTGIFLLPITTAAVLFSVFQTLPNPQNHSKTIVAVIAIVFLSLSSLILTPCAVGTISFAALQSLSGKKTTLSETMKTLKSSFFPVLSTVLVSQTIISSFAVAFVIFVLKITTFRYSLYAILISSALFVAFTMYLQVNWSLAYPVSVFESVKGISALRRSKALVRGNRWLVFSLNLLFMLCYGLISFLIVKGKAFPSSSDDQFSGGDWWFMLFLQAIQILTTSLLMALLQRNYIVAITVLYSFCKKSCEEGFLDEYYFGLPVNDDHKVALLA